MVNITAELRTLVHSNAADGRWQSDVVRLEAGLFVPQMNSTGSRLTCASAAAVTRLSEPGPIDEVTACARRRCRVLA